MGVMCLKLYLLIMVCLKLYLYVNGRWCVLSYTSRLMGDVCLKLYLYVNGR